MRIERNKRDIAYKSGGALAFACSLLLLSASRANGDAFEVTQWLLSAGASVSGGPDDAAFFTTVTNPFNDSHSASLTSPPATASGEYSMAWDGNFGVFHADTTQTAGGNPNLSAASAARIRIIPTTDVTIQIDAIYEYDLASGDRQALMNLAITNASAGGVVWAYLDVVQPIAGDPASGTFELHHTLSLPASTDVYRLHYDFVLNSFSGNPSAISTGSGSATFTITPEPASGIGLLAFALLGSRGRQPHR